MYISRGKEIRRELERLQSDAETQSTAKMSVYVRGNIKRKRETFTAELQVEREKNSLLQEDLAPLLYAPPMESLNIRG